MDPDAAVCVSITKERKTTFDQNCAPETHFVLGGDGGAGGSGCVKNATKITPKKCFGS